VACHPRAAADGGRGAVSMELGHIGRGRVEGAHAIGGAALSICVFRVGSDKVFCVEIRIRVTVTAAPATLKVDQKHWMGK
jgi:hypothetical protein